MRRVARVSPLIHTMFPSLPRAGNGGSSRMNANRRIRTLCARYVSYVQITSTSGHTCITLNTYSGLANVSASTHRSHIQRSSIHRSNIQRFTHPSVAHPSVTHPSVPHAAGRQEPLFRRIRLRARRAKVYTESLQGNRPRPIRRTPPVTESVTERLASQSRCTWRLPPGIGQPSVTPRTGATHAPRMEGSPWHTFAGVPAAVPLAEMTNDPIAISAEPGPA